MLKISHMLGMDAGHHVFDVVGGRLDLMIELLAFSRQVTLTLRLSRLSVRREMIPSLHLLERFGNGGLSINRSREISYWLDPSYFAR